MAALSKELQTTSLGSLLSRIKLSSQPFHFLNLIYKSLKYLLAPNHVLRVALRHAMLLFLLSALPLLARIMLSPLTTWLRRRYLSYTRGASWLRRRDRLQCKLDSGCQDYQEWIATSKQLSEHQLVEGGLPSPHFNHEKLIRDTEQLKQYLSACRHHDATVMSFEPHPIADLMALLRIQIVRNYCGIRNPNISASSNGAKAISAFLEQLCNAITYIGAESRSLSDKEKLIYFNQISHILGRTVLCLSGGASFGPYHTGVVLELWRQRLLPQIISGSSTGAMTAAYFCVFLESKFEDLGHGDKLEMERGLFRAGDLEAMLRGAHRLLRKGHLLKSEVLAQALQSELGDTTFKEAYKRTGKMLNITVTGHDRHTDWRLLNFLTAPDVVIWSAVMASCAFPKLFEPQPLWIKQYAMDAESASAYELVPAAHLYEDEHFLDGSLSNDIPMQRLQQLFNANNFIISQVNPFRMLGDLHAHAASQLSSVSRLLLGELQLYFAFAAGAANRVRRRLTDRHLIRNMAYDQTYDCGERGVVIRPISRQSELLNLLNNPTVDSYNACVKAGARATWQHLPRLTRLCQVEACLDYNTKSLQFALLNAQVLQEEQDLLLLNDASASGLMGRAESELVLSAMASPANVQARCRKSESDVRSTPAAKQYAEPRKSPRPPRSPFMQAESVDSKQCEIRLRMPTTLKI